jgi:hypothetical protein
MNLSIDHVLFCLNDLTSFVSFEKLEGLDSHQSNIYHDLARGRIFGLVSAWLPQHSREENDKNAASLLADLHARGLKCVQLLGHVEDPYREDETNPARAFFFKYGAGDAEKHKAFILSLCNKYSQPAVAAYEHSEVRVFDATGKVLRGFPLATLRVKTLRKIWSCMANRSFVSLESGYLTGNPMWICGRFYDSAGLQSDFSFRSEIPSSLLRYRPLRDKAENEREHRNDIRRQGESLAIKLFDAKQIRDQIKVQLCLDELETYCSKHNLSATKLIEDDLTRRASNLVVLWLLKLRSRRTDGAKRSYEKLEQFCVEQQLDVDAVIARTKSDHPAWSDKGETS